MGLDGNQWDWNSMDSMGLNGTQWDSIALHRSDGRRDVPAELRLRGGAAHVRLEDGRRRRALLDVVIEERCDLDHARADDGGNPRSTQYGTSSSQSMLIIIAIIAHHPRNQCTSSSQSLHIILAIIAHHPRNHCPSNAHQSSSAERKLRSFRCAAARLASDVLSPLKCSTARE